MKAINFLIKPASQKCNMKCKYCFYHDIADVRNVKDYGMMNLETAKNIIQKAYDFVGTGGMVTFAFQGGEPTLRGLDFFDKFINLAQELNINQIKVNYLLQTNGTLIDEQWAKLFKDNNFLIGLSVDGTRKLHNKNRIYRTNEFTFDDVLKASKVLDEYKVAYNILTVVTKEHTQKIKEIYHYYDKRKWNYQQYIACLDPLDNDKGEQEYSLLPADYLLFLNNLFDLWYTDFMNNNYKSVQFMDNVLNIYLGKQPQSCDMRGICSIQNIVEADGSVYPCDFYALEEWKIGNINTDAIEDIFNNETSKKFIKRSLEIHPKCKKCEYYQQCRGGCYRNKIITKNGMHNYYCETYYNFFKRNDLKFRNLAMMIQMQK